MTNRSDPVVIVGGGQSGLAAADGVLRAGLQPLILEASSRPVGSWPEYYDNLTLFSPARHSSVPGHPFSGDPDRYPTRDEVVDYLSQFAARLDAEIRICTRVAVVETASGGGFHVQTDGGETIPASAVIAASGSFGNPYVPDLAGNKSYGGKVIHAAEYRVPERFAGHRVVVVGAGNSAIQIAHELADVASVTLATRQPVEFLPQRVQGRDVHDWLVETGFDGLPPAWLAQLLDGVGTLVLDTGEYQHAIESGRIRRRPMFSGFQDGEIVWADGPPAPVDTVVFATGYRPNLGYLEPLGALSDGQPLHSGGISTTHPGLAYIGLEFQRSFASNTLRGVSRDVDHIVPAIAAYARRAHKKVGL